jgi:hypothetical protein
MKYRCEHCDEVFVNFLRYTKHLKQFHEILPDFRVTCKINGCRNSCTTVRYFVRHVNRKHQITQTVECDPVLNADYHDSENEFDDAVNSCDNVVNTVSEKMSPPSLQQTVNEFEKHIAQCMLKLREQYILPANVQQDVIAEMQLTVSQIHDAYQSIFLTLRRAANFV